MTKNYYNILGVNKKASKEEIKKAFRRLAHKHHPDKKGGNEVKFKEINEAYQVLSDDKKRTEYDSYGQVFGGSPFGDASGFDHSGFRGAGGGFEDIDLGDIFSEFFGGGRRSRVKRGRDISVDLKISFEESVFGTERKVLLNKISTCGTCQGSGAKTGTSLKKCEKCGGGGSVREMKRSIFGTFTSVVECGACQGAGEIPKEPCKECMGAGVLKKQEEVTIKIPAGIENGEMIRLSGGGEAIPRGVAGDLYIKIYVSTHPVFKRSGNDLLMNLNIKLTDALLGSEYAITTLDGNLKLKIPKGTLFGETLRIRGKGIPVGGKKRGDLLVKLNIKMPTKLSRKAEKLIKELGGEGV
ncbi:MAG: molecular chaperone DnaJ [Patescibacteria group bacterium]|nr:MAG: molecular chaperone DnaJ [Patescibacteria group bacterium]